MNCYKKIEIRNAEIDLCCPFCYGKTAYSFYTTETKKSYMDIYRIRCVLHCLNDKCGAEMSLVKELGVNDIGFSHISTKEDLQESRAQLRNELGNRWGKWMANAYKMRDEINSKMGK